MTTVKLLESIIRLSKDNEHLLAKMLMGITLIFQNEILKSDLRVINTLSTSVFFPENNFDFNETTGKHHTIITR